MDKNRVWLAKNDIAQITGLSLAKVNKILERDEQGLPPLPDSEYKMCRPSLLPEHIEFLTSKESLERDAHLSLMQRVKKFNSTFDNF